MKHKNHIFCVLLFPLILSSGLLFAQQPSSASITGKVVGEDGMPAAYVTIKLQNLRRQTRSDENGNFVLINLPAINDTLIAPF